MSATHSSAAPALERSGCPLCGATERRRRRYRFPPFAVVRCRCGFWYLDPRLPEPAMRASYEHDSYFEGEGLGYASYLAQESTLRLTFRRFLGELAARGMVGGRLLEVGCAYGFFLDEARDHFDHRVGTDYSADALARARARAEQTFLGGVDALPAGETFDCIACIHVIEHIYDPLAFLAALRRRLRPGGWIVLATPDMGGWWRPLLGRAWPFFKIPEHVTYFDRRSLVRLLRESGCAPVAALPYRSYFSLDLVAEKLGWRAPSWSRGLRLLLPATTIAAAGRTPR